MQFGYFGKILHQSGFVHFNLPQTFVNVWDDWLLQNLALGKKLHQDQWGSVYRNSPICRFGFSPGIAGETAWIGTMSPSADSQGELYPFCISLALPEYINIITHATQLEAVYQKLVELQQTALSPDYTFSDLQIQMADILPELDVEPSLERKSVYAPSDAAHGPTIYTENAHLLNSPHFIPQLLDAVLQQTWFAYSTWQSPPSDDNKGVTLLSSGLPTGQAALALFDGAWQRSESGFLQLGGGSQGTMATGHTQQAKSRTDRNALKVEAHDPITAQSSAEKSDQSDLSFEFQPTERLTSDSKSAGAKPWKSD